jgi:hypothetical protein
MSAEDEEFTPPDASEEFVPAVFARSSEQAEMYCELLNDHDIPAVVGDAEDAPPSQRGRSMAHGVPVLVPEALLDEAGEVIAEREDAEDEFELGDEEVDDEDEDEFDELGDSFGPVAGPGADEEDDYLVNLDDLEDEDDEDGDYDEEDEEDEED